MPGSQCYAAARVHSAPLTPLQLLRLHVAALFSLDERGRLARVNEPDGGPAPRLFLGRTREGDAWWFRHDVPEDVVLELRAVAPDSSLDAAPYAAILARHAPVQSVWMGPAFEVPSRIPWGEGAVRITHANVSLLSAHLASWMPDVAQGGAGPRGAADAALQHLVGEHRLARPRGEARAGPLRLGPAHPLSQSAVPCATSTPACRRGPPSVCVRRLGAVRCAFRAPSVASP